MPEAPIAPPVHVVVVGGGIAALEAVLALHDLAGARVEVTLVAPEADFVLRPLAVVVPFSRGHVDRLPLEQVMQEHGGQLVHGAVERVDANLHRLTLTTGVQLGYDALILAQGAADVAALPLALTFGEHPSGFSGLLADLEQGYVRSVAFVVPDASTWPLPLYELALMTAEQAWSMNMDHVELHLITPEAEPLGLFGAEAAAAVAELLDTARITVHRGAHARMTRSGVVETGDAEVVADRVVALPVLEGRRLGGVPSDAQGFVPVDDAGRVTGLDDVYAVGDVADRPIKQGGLACQQADAAAADIAVRTGAATDAPPPEQVLRGRLLTQGRDRFMQRRPADGAARTDVEPLWWPPSKVSGKYLSPYLAAKELVHLPGHGGTPTQGIEVHVGVEHTGGGPAPADPLRPITPLHVEARA